MSTSAIGQVLKKLTWPDLFWLALWQYATADWNRWTSWKVWHCQEGKILLLLGQTMRNCLQMLFKNAELCRKRSLTDGGAVKRVTRKRSSRRQHHRAWRELNMTWAIAQWMRKRAMVSNFRRPASPGHTSSFCPYVFGMNYQCPYLPLPSSILLIIQPVHLFSCSALVWWEPICVNTVHLLPIPCEHNLCSHRYSRYFDAPIEVFPRSGLVVGLLDCKFR